MLMLTTTLITSAGAESLSPDYLMFKRIFAEWTDAFNRKDLAGSCALFSKTVTANYQGAPRKTYSSLCDGFKRVFQDKERRYQVPDSSCSMFIVREIWRSLALPGSFPFTKMVNASRPPRTWESMCLNEALQANGRLFIILLTSVVAADDRVSLL